MKTVLLLGAILAFCSAEAMGQGNLDPLTGLPVIPAAETMVAGKSYGFQPGKMPDGALCQSKMQGEFYSISNTNVKDSKIKVSATLEWYAAHLPGFKKIQGDKSNVSVFFNSDGTILVIVSSSGQPGDHDAETRSVAYQKYQPGLSPKAIESFTLGKIVCK